MPLIPLMLLLACAAAPRVPAPELVDDFRLRLSPASLGSELQLSQRITLIRGDERRSFEAQFEADPRSVRIAAVAMGQTVASLSWDGSSFEHRSSAHLPSVVTPARILSDVQLAWWPAKALQGGLPAGYSLQETEGQRSVLHHGIPFASVSYQGTGPAWSHVRLTHHRDGYALDIESVETGR